MSFKPLTILTIAVLLCGSATLNGDVIDDYATGRSGEALKATIHRHCRPTRAVTADEAKELLWTAAKRSPVDPITGVPVTDFSRTEIMYAVPPEWMKPSPTYQAEAANDLHNMLQADAVTVIDRGLQPFSWPTDELPATCPVDELKGDLARMIFYMASIYPCEIWSGWGRNVFDNTPYPTLCDEWSAMYMAWHRSDPVDSRELERNNLIMAAQGNSNPFVNHPELAEYLWGEHAGETYRPSSPSPSGPEDGDSESPLPLRKLYTGADRFIYLYSPYVASDAIWAIDGKQVDGDRIAISELTAGMHELKFNSPSQRGKLLVEIAK